MAETKWLICANGVWPNESVWKPLMNQANVIVACDGALVQCLNQGVRPDIVIGDMDSVDLALQSNLGNATEWIVIEDQENSDLAKAFEHAAKNAAASVDVIGVEGGELGHQIAAYFALLKAPPHSTLYIGTSMIKCANNQSITIDSIEIGSSISLFAFERSSGVTLVGCSWPLNDEVLDPGTRGLNNKASSSSIQLDVSKGAVLICIERP